MRKRLYIVKHEVLARSLAEAARIKSGHVYAIELADEKYQPENGQQLQGFKKTNGKQK